VGQVFREMHRVLKPGGTAIMSFSNRCFPTKGIASSSLLLIAWWRSIWAGREVAGPRVRCHSTSAAANSPCNRIVLQHCCRVLPQLMLAPIPATFAIAPVHGLAWYLCVASYFTGSSAWAASPTSAS
jgi:SAM-dependent methyltransferase